MGQHGDDDKTKNKWDTAQAEKDERKSWKKNEDIPLRFDQLPTPPSWEPVGNVIRRQREETAKIEEQQNKIKPPNSDSESDTLDDIDKVTKSMMKWGLRTDIDVTERIKPRKVLDRRSSLPVFSLRDYDSQLNSMEPIKENKTESITSRETRDPRSVEMGYQKPMDTRDSQSSSQRDQDFFGHHHQRIQDEISEHGSRSRYDKRSKHHRGPRSHNGDFSPDQRRSRRNDRAFSPTHRGARRRGDLARNRSEDEEDFPPTLRSSKSYNDIRSPSRRASRSRDDVLSPTRRSSRHQDDILSPTRRSSRHQDDILSPTRHGPRSRDRVLSPSRHMSRRPSGDMHDPIHHKSRRHDSSPHRHRSKRQDTAYSHNHDSRRKDDILSPTRIHSRRRSEVLSPTRHGTHHSTKSLDANPSRHSRHHNSRSQNGHMSSDHSGSRIRDDIPSKHPHNSRRPKSYSRENSRQEYRDPSPDYDGYKNSDHGHKQESKMEHHRRRGSRVPGSSHTPNSIPERNLQRRMSDGMILQSGRGHY